MAFLIRGKGVPVTRRALLQRINRRLKDEGEVVYAARGTQARRDLGDYYRLDLSRNAVIEKDVNPEALGRKLGVLQQYEYLRAREG